MPKGSSLVKINPTGCGDASPDDGPPGVMTALTNLVPDPSNQNIWVPRPAAQVFTATAAQFSPGFICASFITGRYNYGMVSSALNAGKDQPFAYDLIGGAFIPITGITNANTPTSPLTSGAWTPPTMDQVGVYILVTHPGFTGAGNGFFGWINVSNPAAPTWASGNFSAPTATVTVTIASPAVVTVSGMTPYAGERVILSTTGALPTGLTAGTPYYVSPTQLSPTTFQISSTPDGFSIINTSGSQSGVHTGAFGITQSLPSPATFVKQFNQRAFFAVAPAGIQPATYASDVLAPLTATNPLILTYGDNRPLFAMCALGQQNVFGGVTQALLVFKDNNIFQVTGDWGVGGGLGNLVLNSLNISIGTIAPLSVVPTPRGVAFLSYDGFRIIDWQGHISDPIGLGGTGVVVPFTQALVPSRVVAACNGQTIRATTQNNAAVGQPFQEWVFDLERKIWHGPHTFPASQIQRYGNSYVVAPVGLTGLWQSDILPNVTSQYTENGVQLMWKWQSALIANQDSLYERAVVNSTIYCGGDAVLQQFTMTGENATGSPLSSVPVSPPITPASQWGTMQWGSGTWGAAQLQMSHVVVPWDQPLVFDRVRFTMQGMSAAGVAIGEMRLMVEELEYMAVLG